MTTPLQDKINKNDTESLTKTLDLEAKARPKEPTNANRQDAYTKALEYAFATLKVEITRMNLGKTDDYRNYIIENLTAREKLLNSGPIYPVQLTLNFNNGARPITVEINYDNPAHNIEDPKSWRNNGMAAVCLYRAVEKGERNRPADWGQRVWNLYPHFGYELTDGPTLLLRGHSYITFTSMIMDRPSRPPKEKHIAVLNFINTPLTVKAPMTGGVEILKFKDQPTNRLRILEAEKTADKVVKEAKP